MILWAMRCKGKGCPFEQGRLCTDEHCGTESDEVVIPSSVSAHEGNLRKLRCVVTGATQGLSLHHCRGASMKESPFGTPGAGQKQNGGLQIRLAMRLHVGTPQAVDGGRGVETWEQSYGTQVEHLNSTCYQLRYSVWMFALRLASHLTTRRVELFCEQSPSLFLRASTSTGASG